MGDRLLYIETVAAEALDLVEDITCLGQVKGLLNRVRDRSIDHERIDEVWNKVNSMERELTFLLRHKYLQTKPKPISEALRKRLRQEIKEGNNNGKL